MKWYFDIKFFMILLVLSLDSKALEACTWERVLEALSSNSMIRSRLLVQEMSQTNPQDPTSHQMCLLESLFQRPAIDSDLYDDLLLHTTFDDITSHPDISDLQAEMIQEVIETASSSNDVNETLLIQSILHRRRRVFIYQDGFEYRDYAQVYGSRVRGLMRQNTEFAFSFSPEKAELVSFILRRGDNNNHYNEHRILNVVLEANATQVTAQDVRNVKIALMTAGRDLRDNTLWGYRRGYGEFGRTRLVRYMLGYNVPPDISMQNQVRTLQTLRSSMDVHQEVSRQKKDLFALVAALEHPDNRIYESVIFRSIATNPYQDERPDDRYQCIVDALHAYMAPGRQGKSQVVSYNLGRMIRFENCLNDPYFDRPYFTEHDIQQTLDEALKTLENGNEVIVPYQCVGNPCP